MPVIAELRYLGSEDNRTVIPPRKSALGQANRLPPFAQWDRLLLCFTDGTPRASTKTTASSASSRALVLGQEELALRLRRTLGGRARGQRIPHHRWHLRRAIGVNPPRVPAPG